MPLFLFAWEPVACIRGLAIYVLHIWKLPYEWRYTWIEVIYGDYDFKIKVIMFSKREKDKHFPNMYSGIALLKPSYCATVCLKHVYLRLYMFLNHLLGLLQRLFLTLCSRYRHFVVVVTASSGESTSWRLTTLQLLSIHLRARKGILAVEHESLKFW